MNTRVRLIVLTIVFFWCLTTFSQQKIIFYAADSIKISADLYLQDYDLPYILLFHQHGASRGEYRDIAPKLMKMGYNCLAVDLRLGGRMNFIQNETSQQFMGSFPKQTGDIMKDIEAAVNYTEKISHKSIILLGSSFSASACLIYACHKKNIRAIVAFSPGEYFEPHYMLRDNTHDFDKKALIACSTEEFEYVDNLTSNLPSTCKTLYYADSSPGIHGAMVLCEQNKSHKEFWLALSIFFNSIK